MAKFLLQARPKRRARAERPGGGTGSNQPSQAACEQPRPRGS